MRKAQLRPGAVYSWAGPNGDQTPTPVVLVSATLLQMHYPHTPGNAGPNFQIASAGRGRRPIRFTSGSGPSRRTVCEIGFPVVALIGQARNAIEGWANAGGVDPLGPPTEVRQAAMWGHRLVFGTEVPADSLTGPHGVFRVVAPADLVEEYQVLTAQHREDRLRGREEERRRTIHEGDWGEIKKGVLALAERLRIDLSPVPEEGVSADCTAMTVSPVVLGALLDELLRYRREERLAVLALTERCTAHETRSCVRCRLHPASCVGSAPECAEYLRTGMHWKGCPNRVADWPAP